MTYRWNIQVFIIAFSFSRKPYFFPKNKPRLATWDVEFRFVFLSVRPGNPSMYHVLSIPAI